MLLHEWRIIFSNCLYKSHAYVNTTINNLNVFFIAFYNGFFLYKFSSRAEIIVLLQTFEKAPSNYLGKKIAVCAQYWKINK